VARDLPDGGDCYQAAYGFMDAALTQGRWKGLFLCHGEVEGQGPLEGIRFGHAWCERELPGVVVVTDPSNGRMISMMRDDYYRLGRIDPDEVRRYHPAEMIADAMEYETYGPWPDGGSAGQVTTEAS